MHLKNLRRDVSVIPSTSNLNPFVTAARFTSDGVVYSRTGFTWSDRPSVAFAGVGIVGLKMAPTEGNTAFRVKATSSVKLPFVIASLSGSGNPQMWTDRATVAFTDKVDDVFVLNDTAEIGFGFEYSGTVDVQHSIHVFRMESRMEGFHASEV